MGNSNRRGFFRELLRQGAKTITAFEEGAEEARAEKEYRDFFKSYESSYALTLCEEELLIESARREGIETKDHDRNRIAKELFDKQGGF